MYVGNIIHHSSDEKSKNTKKVLYPLTISSRIKNQVLCNIMHQIRIECIPKSGMLTFFLVFNGT